MSCPAISIPGSIPSSEAGVSVNPYTLDDVIAALNRVQPHDWAAFFRQRVYSVQPRPPLAGIENGGWKLTYGPQRPDYWTTTDGKTAGCCSRLSSCWRFSSAARWRAAISSRARRFASMRTWE